MQMRKLASCSFLTASRLLASSMSVWALFINFRHYIYICSQSLPLSENFVPPPSAHEHVLLYSRQPSGAARQLVHSPLSFLALHSKTKECSCFQMVWCPTCLIPLMSLTMPLTMTGTHVHVMVCLISMMIQYLFVLCSFPFHLPLSISHVYPSVTSRRWL